MEQKSQSYVVIDHRTHQVLEKELETRQEWKQKSQWVFSVSSQNLVVKPRWNHKLHSWLGQHWKNDWFQGQPRSDGNLACFIHTFKHQTYWVLHGLGFPKHKIFWGPVQSWGLGTKGRGNLFCLGMPFNNAKGEGFLSTELLDETYLLKLFSGCWEEQIMFFSLSLCLTQRPAFFLPESLDISTDHGKIYFLKNSNTVITRIHRQYSILLAQYLGYSLQVEVVMLTSLKELNITQWSKIKPKPMKTPYLLACLFVLFVVLKIWRKQKKQSSSEPKGHLMSNFGKWDKLMPLIVCGQYQF